jgi:membrane associated rhomboid family serine protease
MSDGYFRRRSARPVNVDWGRHVREDAERAGQVLWTLIAVNVVVFVMWQLARGTVLQPVMADHFLVSLESVANYRLWTLLTCAFSQKDPVHLLFNMFGLWVFGRDVAQAVGWKALLNLYLVGGVAASVGHVLYSVVTGDLAPALGASGSVMAVSVMYACLFPNRTILLQFFIPVPAAIAVALFILLDVLGMVGGGGGIAHAAHLAGAAYGLAWWWFRVR